MPASQDRQRSKSARRIKMKSPLNLAYKISLNDNSQQKNILKKSKGTNSQSTDSDRKTLKNHFIESQNNSKGLKNWASPQDFKNKIMISSGQFNRLKQKLQTYPHQVQGHHNGGKKSESKKLKIKIFNGMSKQTSNTSEKTSTNDTNNKSSGSSDSQQIELLKVENEYFKKIYDDALSELSKLKHKLKQEKKVHEVQKQIYENQLNKLKRIVDQDRQQENRYIIVVSNIDNNGKQELLGIDSTINSDEDNQVADLSLESRI